MESHRRIVRCAAACVSPIALILLLRCGSAGGAASRQDAAEQPFDLDHVPAGYDHLYRELQSVFRRFYPQATSHQLGPEMHFEFNTRLFLIHLPTKTGHWQDPSAIRGPMQGGIHCNVSVARGQWRGAAAVPQNFDRHYFLSRLSAPHDAERDLHLVVHLDTPSDVSPEFVAEFTKRVNSFGRYLQ